MLLERHERHNARDQKKSVRERRSNSKRESSSEKIEQDKKSNNKLRYVRDIEGTKLCAKESVGKYCTLIK